ncbi:MAG TPA: tetratricopeptide repeat protein [Bryobacteraceae bacterium]
MLGCVAFAQNAQTPAASTAETKSSAYYNFAMGRLYAELADSQPNDRDYVNQAIKYYQEALKQDPSAGIVFEELTDLLIRSGRLSDAVTQAEDILKRNPENLQARRVLGRIYFRAIPDSARGSLNQANLDKAIEQYKIVTEKDPKDVESWVMLGRLYRISNKSPEAEKAFEAALKIEPDSEDALTGLAGMYSDLGDTQKAIEKLKAVTEKSPSERTLAALASAYESLQDYKDAAEVLKKALEMAPDNPRLVRGLAQDLFFSDQIDEALKIYEQLAKDEPRDPRTRLRLAQIYRSKRDFAKAHEALNRARQLDGEDMEVRYEEVNLLEAENKTSEAIAALKSLIDETAKRSYSPPEAANRAMLLERLGVLYRANEQYQLAIDALRQIGGFSKDRAAEIQVQIIETYRASKDYDNALKEADAAVKKFPDSRVAKIEHANVLGDRGKVDEAAGELKALMDGSHDRETHLAIAQLYEKAKRYSDMANSLDAAEKLSKTNEDQVTVHFMRGAMYERTKKFEQAEAEFRKVLAIDPDYAGALNYLGYMLADRNVRLDEANTLVKKALDLDPDNGAYLDSLGWIYYRQGKLSEAEGLLVRALEKIGTDPTVHDHLGDVYFKQGKTREAISQWQASLKGFESSGSQGDVDPDEVASVNKKLESARVKLAREGGGR